MACLPVGVHQRRLRRAKPGLDVAGAGGRPALRGRLRPERQLQRCKRRPLARLLLPQHQASSGEAEAAPRADATLATRSGVIFDLRIVRCTNMSAAEVEKEKQWTNVSMPFPAPWSGTCAPHDDIDALVDYEGGLPVNMFFNLSSEPDWTKSRWNEPRAGMDRRKTMAWWGRGPCQYRRCLSSSAMQCRLYLKHGSDDQLAAQLWLFLWRKFSLLARGLGVQEE